MENVFKILGLSLLVVLASCSDMKKKAENAGDQIEVIEVGASVKSIEYSDFFSSTRFVPLETKPESLLGQINRLSFSNNRIYVLDKAAHSVFIFDNEGKFINKVQSIGKGPNEYLQLSDFAIDEETKTLVLYSNIPYKLLYYTLDGTFTHEQGLNVLYDNIAIGGKEILMIDKSAENGYYFNVKSMDSQKSNKFIPESKKEKLFENFNIGGYPIALKSQSVYTFLLPSTTIYEYIDNEVFPRYELNFGDRAIPEALFDGSKSAMEIYQSIEENDYGSLVANFRESENYITFSYGLSEKVIYSKKDKAATVFNNVRNEKEKNRFWNHFGHDGDDDNYVFIESALDLKNKYLAGNKKTETWASISLEVRGLVQELNELDNPVLVIFTLK